MIKHLTPKSMNEIQKSDFPFWKRRETIFSPLIIFIGLGYGIYYILFGFFGLLNGF